MSPKYIKLIVAAGATLLGGGAIATTTNIKPAQEVATPIAIEETKPTITQETITKTLTIPHETSYIEDANLPKGQTRVTTKGQDGVKVEYYTVTYEDGVEINRTLDRTETTTSPITEIIAQGTYVPSQPRAETTHCHNSTYVNSAGNSVCRPSTASSSNATALCRDGTYSYSQSRRGTCSHHGGVHNWL